MSQIVLITWKGNKTISQTSSETAVKIFAALENLFIGSPPSEFTKTHILPLGYDIRYILIGKTGKVKRFGKADVKKKTREKNKMGLGSYTVRIYVLRCDECGRTVEVPKAAGVYNGAQAARTFGWSYGKDGRIKCDRCRQFCKFDRHKNK